MTHSDPHLIEGMCDCDCDECMFTDPFDHNKIYCTCVSCDPAACRCHEEK